MAGSRPAEGSSRISSSAPRQSASSSASFVRLPRAVASEEAADRAAWHEEAQPAQRFGAVGVGLAQLGRFDDRLLNHGVLPPASLPPAPPRTGGGSPRPTGRARAAAPPRRRRS